jgi:fucose 4-O-acetylase-like acetyltransferase
MRNGSRSVFSLLQVWHPIAHLWFLPFLVVATALVAAARPWIARPWPIAGLVALLSYSVLAWGWNPNIVGIRGLSLVGFVAIGSAIGSDRMGRLMSARFAYWLPVGAASALAFVLLLTLSPVAATLSSDAPVWTRAISVVAAAFGTCFLLTVAVLLGKAPSGVGWLADIGRKTLPIYLAHVICAAGARVALQHLGVRDALVFSAVCLVIGVGVPLIAATYAPRLHLGWLFDLPSAVKTRLPGNRSRVLVAGTAA